MIRIKPIPVGYLAQEANGISIRLMPFQTNAVECSTYYQLVSITVDEEENEIVKHLADGNSPITPEQFTEWGSDNTYIENIVLTNLSLERE